MKCSIDLRVIAVILASASSIATAAPSPPSSSIDAVEKLMQSAQVPGLALALISDGKVSLVKSFGKRDVARDLPLATDTVMYGASLTKATFAYLVMQLVDEGKIELDRPIGTYLPKPLPDYPRYSDLAGDPRWRKLTMRMLLDHTTGFANFRWVEDDKKLRWSIGIRARVTATQAKESCWRNSCWRPVSDSRWAPRCRNASSTASACRALRCAGAMTSPATLPKATRRTACSSRMMTEEGDPVEGYHVLIGGGFGPQAAIGRELYRDVTAEEAPRTVERILKAYLAHRASPDESFLAFARRHEIDALKAMAELEAAA